MCLNHTTIFKDFLSYFLVSTSILYDIDRQSIKFSFFLTSIPSPFLSVLPGPPPSDLAMPKGLHELPFEEHIDSDNINLCVH